VEFWSERERERERERAGERGGGRKTVRKEECRCVPAGECLFGSWSAVPVSQWEQEEGGRKEEGGKRRGLMGTEGDERRIE